MTVKRPIVRYHGGKWLLAPWIISHFPKHRTYVEPFGGGGSVLLRKERCHAEVYNDLDSEMVNLFRVVRDNGPILKELLGHTPFAREEYAQSWLPCENPIERARRTVIRSFMGFGSAAATENRDNGRVMTGFRSNSDRSGTTPARDWLNYPECLSALISRVQGVVIENRQACVVMETHDSPDTLNYVDPPYVAETRDKGSDYRHEMTVEDHRELADLLKNLKGSVVLSGYRCKLYDELFCDWERVERTAYADGGRPRIECLWLKNVGREALLL